MSFTLPKIISSLGFRSQRLHDRHQRIAVRAPNPLHPAIPHHDTCRTRLELVTHAQHGRWLRPLEEHKGRHGADAVAARDCVDMVDVDFGEGELAGGGVRVGELREDRRDCAARGTPIGVEVHDDVLGGLEEGVELGGGGELVDFD